MMQAFIFHCRWIKTCWTNVCGGVKCCFGCDDEGNDEETSVFAARPVMGGNTPPTDTTLGGEVKPSKDHVSGVCLHTEKEHLGQKSPIAMVTIEMNDPGTNSPKITLVSSGSANPIMTDAVNGHV